MVVMTPFSFNIKVFKGSLTTYQLLGNYILTTDMCVYSSKSPGKLNL